MSEVIKTHDDDTIFSLDSLKEFIRLIQRQGINNLTIYSVNDLLNNDKYKTIKTRMPPPHFTAENHPAEFELAELENKRNYFVFVRYSFSWEEGGKLDEYGNYKSNNELNGRHIFVQTVNDIKYYKKLDNNGNIDTNVSSVFSQDTTELTTIPENYVFPNNVTANATNGTFTTNVDSTQYVIKIRGFNNDGKYTGEFLPSSSSATSGTFLRGDGQWANTIANSWLPITNNAYNLGNSEKRWKNLYISDTSSLGDTQPSANNTYDLGTSSLRWANVYGVNGNFSGSLTIAGRTLRADRLPSTASTSAYFWRGDGNWHNTLEGAMTVTGVMSITNNTGASSKTTGALRVTGGIGCQGNIYGNKVYNAVFNDYAECRKTINLTPGHVVIDNDDGSLSCTSKRLQPGAQVISDTFGNLMGETEECKTPLAVAGRVLVYTYQPREKYHAGMAVCSAPDGTVDIMTREEIKEYPDCIIGIVSEIPKYENWGTDNVKVNGRIWIKVK